jgi:hypothetical protein
MEAVYTALNAEVLCDAIQHKKEEVAAIKVTAKYEEVTAK